MKLTEFDLIERFVRGSPRAGEGVILGIGDDAAVLRAPRGEELVMTVDAVVEGVHFDGRFSPEEIGWKALAVNLSDLAAMGGRPLWALCALATPRDERPKRLVGVGRGLAACARAYGTALIGGNVTRARDLSVTVTVIGAVARGRALLRSGAKEGDLLVVSGCLGAAALGRARQAHAALVRRQRHPVPRLALGRALAGRAHAALDISDGLLQDLGHLCQASGVGAEVRLAALPLPPPAQWARVSKARAIEAALGGGEDYELLAAVPPRRLQAAQAVAKEVGVALTVIGEVTRRRGIRAVDDQGARVAVPLRGHDHLRKVGARLDILSAST